MFNTIFKKNLTLDDIKKGSCQKVVRTFLPGNLRGLKMAFYGTNKSRLPSWKSSSLCDDERLFLNKLELDTEGVF